jgi:hypothetical protein
MFAAAKPLMVQEIIDPEPPYGLGFLARSCTGLDMPSLRIDCLSLL